jgi:pSer/pThr/pTyr-binding forkhead associated (FHA) protein/ABC-type multidrug transport system ATPase subunit
VYKIRIGSLPDNDVVFAKPMVSGHHAEICFEDGRLTLVDLHSTNGTFLNGVKVSRAEVTVGQEIALGSFRFTLDQAHVKSLYARAAHKAATKAAPETLFEEAPSALGAAVTAPVTAITPAVSRAVTAPVPPPSTATLFEDDLPTEDPIQSNVHPALVSFDGDIRAITIGYHERNAVCIPAPQVSGQHARITAEGGVYTLSDLGSTNGTFLNGARVQGNVTLAVGDRIALGSYTFTFDASLQALLDEAPPQAPTALAAAPATAPPQGAFATQAMPAISLSALPGLTASGGSLTLRIGRAEDNDLVIPAPQVSAYHVELRRIDAERWQVTDHGSTNRTYINVRSVPIAQGEPVTVSAQDVLFLGSYRFPMSRVSDLHAGAASDSDVVRFPEGKDSLTIGRDDTNDIVLNAPQVSRVHARLTRAPQGWLLEDLGSANGTFINSARLSAPRLIGPQDLVGFGSYMTRLDPGGGSLRKEYQGDIKLRAEGLSIDIPDPKAPGGKRRILDDVSFTAYPTEFIGLMGPSGAGKTTLMMALNGYLVPSSGRSLINDLDLYANYNSFRGNIGYVPQDDIIHPELTVFESLYFTAKLRLPPDTSDAEILSIIDRTLQDLGILDTKNVIIGSPLKKGISGGQRKRVNLAQELITQPALLFLDEPTSGLASSDTRNIMRLLRRLADDGRTILLTIHQPSLEAYREMDNVLYLAQGKLIYYGPAFPDSIAYFNPTAKPGTPSGDRVLQNPDEAMSPLAADNAAPNAHALLNARRTSYQHSRYFRDYVSGRRDDNGQVAIRSGTKQRTARKFGLRQWLTLTRRALTIKRKDVGGSAILLLQAPIIATLISVVFSLSSGEADNPVGQFVENQSQEGINAAALFMLIASAVWFGTSNAAREIVSEQAIYRRERMVNLMIPSYVLSKFAVLALLSFIQCALLLGITYPALGFAGNFFGMLLTLFLCSTAGLGIGLLLSSLVRSSEAAVGLVPLLLIPQLILGGLIVPIEKLEGGLRQPVRYTANAMIARWGFEGVLHLEQANRPPPSTIQPASDILTWITRLERKVLNAEEFLLPPRPPLPFAGEIPQSKVEDFKKIVEAWFQHYLSERLNQRQQEVRALDRYFGPFTSSFLTCLLILLAFNILLLCLVCGILRVRDVEVG